MLWPIDRGREVNSLARWNVFDVASGIYLGIRIPQRLKNVELTIYEKNDGFGGTWWENRYPGVACDIPSHSYQYSFCPNRNWSRMYAPGSEIQQYLESVAHRYSVPRFVKFKHEVQSCTWDDGVWRLKVRGASGEILESTADVLISARGALNELAWPDIEGLNSFFRFLIEIAMPSLGRSAAVLRPNAIQGPTP